MRYEENSTYVLSKSFLIDLFRQISKYKEGKENVVALYKALNDDKEQVFKPIYDVMRYPAFFAFLGASRRLRDRESFWQWESEVKEFHKILTDQNNLYNLINFVHSSSYGEKFFKHIFGSKKELLYKGKYKKVLDCFAPNTQPEIKPIVEDLPEFQSEAIIEQIRKAPTIYFPKGDENWSIENHKTHPLIIEDFAKKISLLLDAY